MKSHILLTLLFVFPGIGTHSGVLMAQSDRKAGQAGQVYFQKYTSEEISANFEEYSPQSWAIVQDKRGVMYFANNSGILEYDGKEWRMVEGSSWIFCTGLALLNDEIFVGGANEIGVLSANESGGLYYKSLVNKLDEENREFGRIWRTFASDSAVYFLTLQKLFRWKDGRFKTWSVGEMRKFFPAASVNNRVYVNVAGFGFCELVYDELELLFPSIGLKDSHPYLIEQFIHKDQLLLGVHDQGLFIYENKRLRPFKTQIDDILKENLIYTGLKIYDNLWAIGTQYAGYFLIDSAGNPFTAINKENVLEDNFVGALYADKQEGIWSTSNVGDIYRAEALSPLTYYADDLGLNGLIWMIVRFEGILYVGTLNGLFYLDETTNRFVRMEKIKLAVFNFLFKDDRLLIFGSDGIFVIKGREIDNLSSISSSAIFPVTQKMDTIITFTQLGIFRLRLQGKIYEISDTISAMEVERVNNIVQGADGSIWLDGQSVLLHIKPLDERFDKVELTSYDTSNGLPAGNIYIPYKINNEILIGTAHGVFRYDEKTGRFSDDDIFGDLFKGEDTKPLVEDGRGNIWVCSENRTGKVIKDGNGNYHFDYVATLRMEDKNVWTIYPDENGIVWIGTTKGLVRYDTKTDKNYQTEYHTLVRKVLIHQDSVIFWGTYYDEEGKACAVQPDALKPVLDYTYNSIVFQYSATNYEKEKNNRFSYFLEGFDEDWSAWSLKSEKEYTNLPEGKYTFRVKSINIYEHEGLEGKYEFTILTPFYRSRWFYGGQIGFLMLMFGISYYFGRSGGKLARLAPVMATVAIVILFEYFQNYVEDNFANLLGGITVLKVLVNVLLVFMLLPLEKILKRLFGKE